MNGGRLALYDFEKSLHCRNIVAFEIYGMQATDLDLIEHGNPSILHVCLLFPAFCEITLEHSDIRVQLAQHRSVGRMLVNGHDVCKSRLHQPDDKILRHQCGSAGDNDFLILVH